jgi:predicted DNA-binding antitoxin AbrB/MazE fold protein
MPVIEAVFKNGVFRPLTSVELPEGTRVTVTPLKEPVGIEVPDLQESVHEILSRRYRSGLSDTAARIDEHQP